MSDVPALAEHLAIMVTARDTPRYQTVLKDNIRFLERELAAALASARKAGAREERERLAKAAEAAEARSEPILVAVQQAPREWQTFSVNGWAVSSWLRSQGEG
jgi:hypothetical protein